MKKKMVVVVWEDVSKKQNEFIFDEDVSIDDLSSTITTIGWIHKETDRNLLIAQEYDNDDDSVRDWIIIPKALIVKKQALRIC